MSYVICHHCIACTACTVYHITVYHTYHVMIYRIQTCHIRAWRIIGPFYGARCRAAAERCMCTVGIAPRICPEYRPHRFQRDFTSTDQGRAWELNAQMRYPCSNGRASYGGSTLRSSPQRRWASGSRSVTPFLPPSPPPPLSSPPSHPSQ